MGYHFEFLFVKDELVDANKVFIQNVDNFLLCIYFGYVDRHERDTTKQRNKVISLILRDVKTLILSGGYDVYDDDARRDVLENIELLSNLPFDTEIYLMLYGVFVSSLSKTKKESFTQIKKELKPLIDCLKNNFSEFDKNEIHKNRTFIYQLRSPNWSDDDFYILDGTDFIRIYHEEDGNDVKGLSLTTEDREISFVVKSRYKGNYVVKKGIIIQDGEERKDEYELFNHLSSSILASKGDHILKEFIEFDMPYKYYKL